ncbi:MAG: OmpA family protein [Verrucomicrobia bacterium]|nr:OmpA family protein [Verrucomicrobiota bacterium]
MKPFSKLGSIALVLILSLAAGCKKGQKNYTPLPGYSGTPGASSGIGKGQPILPPARPLNQDGAGSNGSDAATGVNNPDGVNGQPSREEIEGMLANREQFKANTVYFDYDKSVVKADGKANIQAVASYLKAHADNKVAIEGHCDEGGTEEYNRSLGVIAVGIGADRVVTRSFGEDKPAELGHDEAAWGKNRRGEFILLTPPPAGGLR